MKMWTRSGNLAASALFAASLFVLAGSASAAPVVDHLALTAPSSGMVENVYWRGRGWGGGWGWGAPVAGGLIAGALIGGALASPYYGYGPGPYYPPGYYAPGPAYYGAPPPPPGDDYCFRRFKSYDPQSGTYLGNDGRRHPCP